MLRPGVTSKPIRFKVSFESCPVEASLGVLGRKWALLVLRDVGLFHAQRFNEILRATPGLTKRTLSLRLHELEREGFIYRAENDPKYVRWELTQKGRDVLPVLMTLVQFGAKWHAERVFADKRSRPLTEIFDEAYIQKVLEVPRRVTSRPVRSLPKLASTVAPETAVA
jgi:DNA-binding HxlR family transcriptional regulator